MKLARVASFCAAAAVATATFACGGYSSTVRIVDGERLEGRAIAPAAYAAYLNAAQLEAQGDAIGALKAYEIAKSRDSSSVEIQTCIAKLTCQLHPSAAREVFEEALEIDEEYEAAWREWGLCELRKGNLTRALRLTKRAVTHAPASLAATTAVAQVHEARKEPEQAIRQLVAYVTLFPESRAAWRELYLTARRQGDVGWKRVAAEVLHEELDRESPLTSGEPAVALVSEALLEGGLAKARPTAVQHGMPPLEVAWLALDLGLAKEALAQAELVLGANPEDLDAAIAALLAQRRAGSRAGLGERLRAMPSPRGARLSERSVAALRDLLRELADADAARTFVEQLASAYAPPAEEPSPNTPASGTPASDTPASDAPASGTPVPNRASDAPGAEAPRTNAPRTGHSNSSEASAVE